MSEKDINKEAFKKAEEELLKSKVEKVKGYILHTLEKIEKKKKQKELIEEELRILKLDLEDLRNGRFDKIEERVEKSKIARQVSVPNIETLASSWVNDCLNRGVTIQSAYLSTPANTWTTYTSGTYNITDFDGSVKTYYLN